MSERDEAEARLLTRREAVSTLERFRKEHVELLHDATSAAPNNLYPEDHLVVAALVRSLANIDGFLTLVDQGNKFCAMPLVRFQLDSAMRVFACTLVNDTMAFVEHVLKGGLPSKLKDRHGKKLHDGYLKQKLAERCDHVEEVYSYSSGYVHLSNQHLFSVLDLEASQKGTLTFANYEILPSWDEEQVRSTLVQFVWAADILLEICKDWQERKRRRGGGGSP